MGNEMTLQSPRVALGYSEQFRTICPTEIIHDQTYDTVYARQVCSRRITPQLHGWAN